MIETTQDVQSLTAFRENSEQLIGHLKMTRRPMTLTVNGHAEVVVQDAEAYQRLLDIAALADPEEGLRQGLENIAENRTYPAREIFAQLREEYGIRG